MWEGYRRSDGTRDQSYTQEGCAARSRQGSVARVSKQRAHSVGSAAAPAVTRVLTFEQQTFPTYLGGRGPERQQRAGSKFDVNSSVLDQDRDLAAERGRQAGATDVPAPARSACFSLTPSAYVTTSGLRAAAEK